MESKRNRKESTSQVKEQNEIYSEYDRFEMIDHVRYDLKPAPSINHQVLAGNLYFNLKKTCSLDGVILITPLDVYLDEGNTFQPDLVYVHNDNLAIIKEARIEGAPNLVVEILSPSTSTNDKIRKKAQYERFGVQEYWIIDPVHRTVDQFILSSGKFILHATYGDELTLTSDLFPCIHLTMDELFTSFRR
jgi:Uma2 family endonuclease